MIKPFLQGESFLADVKKSSEESDALHLWWLGQSGYLLQWQHAHLLLDPYLSDSLTKKYATTSKPHIRMTELVIAPERLDFIDIVTSSHNHTDHLDGETVGPLLDTNPQLTIIVPEANRTFAAERFQIPTTRLTGIRCEAPQEVPPFTFHAVPAAHEELDTDEQGNHKYIGLVIEVGPWTIYHSGDTMRYPGMVQRLSQWQIDLALLPINGRDPARGVAGNLSGPEAVELAQNIKAKVVIPCHYDMFTFNTVSPDEFEKSAVEAQQRYQILENGEKFTLK
ncbi:MBL fold metallo-hydrolase [Chloroflexi bacterium TSY]|nr:MBL fold metallo-hydrolase [Chloroflexi bacterium TSY]